jgi:hypothetical protein
MNPFTVIVAAELRSGVWGWAYSVLGGGSKDHDSGVSDAADGALVAMMRAMERWPDCDVTFMTYNQLPHEMEGWDMGEMAMHSTPQIDAYLAMRHSRTVKVTKPPGASYKPYMNTKDLAIFEVTSYLRQAEGITALANREERRIVVDGDRVTIPEHRPRNIEAWTIMQLKLLTEAPEKGVIRVGKDHCFVRIDGRTYRMKVDVTFDREVKPDAPDMDVVFDRSDLPRSQWDS